MKVLLILLVIAVWMGLTSLAAWATPERHQDDTPDLIYDPHWLLRSPPNPVESDHLPARPTTTPPPPAPPPKRVPPRPPPAPEVVTPTPTPTPPAPRSYPPGVEQWRDEVAGYGDWDTGLMLRIMDCESGGNPNADNRSSTANGLFQILGGPFDPIANISLAHTMWSTRGTQPWDASRSCWG